MRWVYAIGFTGDRFLMVHNPKRGGWEMPGGKVEDGESPQDASVREFREEAGVLFLPLGCMEYEGGLVFAGEIVKEDSKGEMSWGLFKDLPKDLAFPAVEYESQLLWARDVLSKHRSETQDRLDEKSHPEIKD
ncbi:MAG TPA: NUDIX domain-containing protein [Methanomassiliicoccales archaeon]|jgi:8-oxo-dGTP diphosphatase